MIFIVDSQGTTKSALYEPIYQGSNSANRIVLLAPFSNSSQCVAHIRLPNGITLEPVYMSSFANDILDAEKLNGWYRNIEYPITQYAGTVDVQFEITTTNGTTMTEMTSFEVRKGNFITPEATEESVSLYREILNAVTRFNSAINSNIDEVNADITDLSEDVQSLSDTVDGINKTLPTIKINEIKLSGKDNTLHLLDENMREIASIDLPFVNVTDFEETTKNIPNNIALILNETNYRLKAKLSSPNGVIAQSNEIDLPIESLVVGAEYFNGKIILSLKNGTSIDVELTDLVKGLVNETEFETFQDDVNGEIGNLQVGISAIDQYATDNINNLQERVSDLEQNSGGGGNITVEQEVNDSDNPVSSKAVKDEFATFSNSYNQIINSAVVKRKEFNDGDILDVENNTDYHPKIIENNNVDISTLHIRIPQSAHICSVMFKTADTGTITIDIMGCKGYIGKAPDLEENGVTWELSIHNGIIASGKVVS